MQLRFLFIFFLLFQISITKAQICKYIVNEKDPLTDDVIRTVRTRLTAPTPFYYFTYIRNGKDYQFKIEVGDYGELENIIPKGSELILRAGNGTIYKMQAIEQSAPEKVKDFSTILTKYVITYQTNEETMRAIADSGIRFIRIANLESSFKDQEFPEAVVGISRENAICIFKE